MDTIFRRAGLIGMAILALALLSFGSALAEGSGSVDSPGGGVGEISDIDGDSVGDAWDNCPYVPNWDQHDTDLDMTGDACDETPFDLDADGDGITNALDGCPTENATGFDANGNGCLDDIADIRQEIHDRVLQGLISTRAERHLMSTLDAAEAAYTRGNLCAVLGQMRALGNQIQTLNNGVKGPEYHSILMQMIAHFLLKDLDKGFCLGKTLAG